MQKVRSGRSQRRPAVPPGRPMSRCRRRLQRERLAQFICISLLAVGCHQDMYDQPKIEPLEASTFFEDGMGARPLVPGTVFRGQTIGNPALTTGRNDGAYVEQLPIELSRERLKRGRERFNIFCANCHSRTGDGDGMVVRRGFPRPPTFHSDRLRGVPVGYVFQVITSGHGAMPAFAHQIAVDDRWAVVAYLRALQLSRHARVDDLPPDERDRFEGARQP